MPIPPDGSVIVTADATYWTADETSWPTADGGLLFTVADIVEPVGRQLTADSSTPRADNIVTTADGAPVLGAGDAFDAAVPAIVAANVVETAAALDTLDGALPGVIAANIVEAASAADIPDADVIPTIVEMPIGGGIAPRRRPYPVIGVGYGVLGELEGDGRGYVYIGAVAAGSLGKLAAAAAGAAGAAGNADAELAKPRIAAHAAHGTRGDALGHANSIAGSAYGHGISHGIGAGRIANLKGAAMGKHDNDAIAIAFLLAA